MAIDTTIVAVLIQEGSRFASEFLKQRNPKAKSSEVDLDKFLADMPSRFPSLNSTPAAAKQITSVTIAAPVAEEEPVKLIRENNRMTSAPEMLETVPPTESKASSIATGCVPCMPPDSLVWSNPGTKEISKLSIGSRVIDKEGKYTTILNMSSRPYNGDLIAITVPGQNTPILLTPEHPVLSIKGKKCRDGTLCFPKENPKCQSCSRIRYEPEFVEAGELSIEGVKNSWSKHFLLQPILKGETDNLVLDVRNIAQVSPTYVRNKIKDTIPINEDFLKLAGLYLAEGSVTVQARGSLLRFDFGYTEQNLVDEVILLLRRVFGVKANFRKETNTLRVYFSSMVLGHFFLNYFGTGASQKRIPQELLTLPVEKQAVLLYGFWLGDGSWLTSYGRNVLSASTISENLAFGLRTILNRLGVVHSLSTNKTRPTKIGSRQIKGGTPQFVIQINSNGAAKLNTLWGIVRDYRFVQSSQYGIDKNWAYLPIKKLARVHYEGPVMNIETESNTYCANGIVVHNCAMGHFGTCSGILNESLRFAHGQEGMASPEVIDRVNMCMDELNAMERIDLRPENLVQLSGWEKELAEKALSESRQIRHNLEGLKNVDNLEQVAAKTQTSRKAIGRAWFEKKLSSMPEADKEEVKRRVIAKIEEMASSPEN